ncbi:unnamed protein product [Rodentolepis nana]|uniref:Skp1_POZ domain-containing protein n=1 Tax=Rodentolepis nana TaxID=102285 RepID=A0A0R3U0N4_RODNA|nr:unnamed protein product [Rodentolepis nana]
MIDSPASREIAAALDLIKDPSNEILECRYCTERCLYLSIKCEPELSFLLFIPVEYPSEKLKICQLSEGVTIGDIKKSIYNISDAVLMIMTVVCTEFKKPIPRLAVKQNPGLYLEWMFDLINIGAVKTSEE